MPGKFDLLMDVNFMFKGTIKAILIFFVFIFIVSGIQVTFAQGYDKYGLIIDDDLSLKNVYITVQSDVAYLPLAPVQKAFGISAVEYNKDGSVSIKAGTYGIYIDTKGEISVNGRRVESVPPAMIKGKEVYIPVIFFADTLRYRIEILDEITCARIITKEGVLPAAKIIDRYKLLNDKAKQDSNTKIAYLTFDDGVDRKVTVQVLDILKKYNIKGTFFIVGNTIDKNKDIVKRIAAEGHSIGNHSYTHRREIIYKSIDGFVDEMNKTDQKILEVTGENMMLFRPPYGMPYIKDQKYKDALAGHKVIAWNIDSMDSRQKGIKSDQIAASVISQLKNKKCAVILFHCSAGHGETAKALPKVIDYLLDNGYAISNIKEDSVLSYSY